MSTPPMTFAMGAGTLGWALGCCRRGASHQRSGAPCQDAYALWSGAVAGTPYLVAAVADGHGDPRHDRSHYGAALAVQVAIEVAQTFYWGSETAPAALKSDFKTHFPRKVGQRWRDSVRQHAETLQTPLETLSPGAQELFTRYGTTLLVAMAVPDALLVGQIGDGALLWVDPAASICDVLLQSPTTLLGTETYSLCAANASHLWQTAAFERSAAGLFFLTTDGLTDALGDDATALQSFALSLSQRLQDSGPLETAKALPGWLDHYSTYGSGDDMTLALLWLAPPQPTADAAEETQHEPEHRPTRDSGSPATAAARATETR